jgi:hypothetical protein
MRCRRASRAMSRSMAAMRMVKWIGPGILAAARAAASRGSP